MAIASTEELAHWRPQLLAFALRRVRSREQAEDAVQETLVAALEGLDRYGGGSALGTWLFGILKHKIVDGFRRGSREEPLELNEEELRCPGPGPEQTCASSSALSVIGRSLDKLPRKSAHAFVLREILGLDTAEVCRTLRVTPTHCWVLVHRARKRLRRCPDIGLLAAEAG
jgi:RNA polymerase sigma-70 factor (ECF subfamily)